MSTYDPTKPEDTGFLSEAPADLRANFKGLKEDQIVDAALLRGLAPGNANGQIPVSNGSECENLNAAKLNGKTSSDFAPKAHGHDTATASSDGFITAAQNNKLAGIQANAEVNQNAFSNVLINGTVIQSDSKTDTLEIVAGDNITILADATNDRIILKVSGKVPSAGYADSAGSAPANGGTADTISGTISGNQVIALRSNTSTDLGIAREFRWRAYGNNHTIIDNSKAEYPGNNTNAQSAWMLTYPVLMGYNGSQTFGVRVDSARVADTAGNVTGTVAIANGGTGATTAAQALASLGASCGLGTIAKEISGGDVNGLATFGSGNYRGINLTHAPDSGWWYIEHIAHDETNCTQTATAYGVWNSYPIGTKLTRCLTNGVWSDWDDKVSTKIKDYVIGQSLSVTSWWTKWASGKIEQGGQVAGVIGVSGSITFPIEFPTEVIMNPIITQSGYNGPTGEQVTAFTVSKTGFTYGWSAFNTIGAGGACKINYFVVGR